MSKYTLVNVAVSQDASDSNILYLNPIDQPRSATFAECQRWFTPTDNSNMQVRLVFKDPYTLQTLLALSICTPNRSVDAIHQPSNESLTFSLDIIHHLRVKILGLITSVTILTPTEENGTIDGPVTAPLMQGWRDAFRGLVNVDGWFVRTVQFDMHCEKKDVALRHVVRVLQHASTLLVMKARKKGEQEVKCEVVGCEDEMRKSLVGSMLGVEEQWTYV